MSSVSCTMYTSVSFIKPYCAMIDQKVKIEQTKNDILKGDSGMWENNISTSACVDRLAVSSLTHKINNVIYRFAVC